MFSYVLMCVKPMFLKKGNHLEGGTFVSYWCLLLLIIKKHYYCCCCCYVIEELFLKVIRVQIYLHVWGGIYYPLIICTDEKYAVSYLKASTTHIQYVSKRDITCIYDQLLKDYFILDSTLAKEAATDLVQRCRNLKKVQNSKMSLLPFLKL